MRRLRGWMASHVGLVVRGGSLSVAAASAWRAYALEGSPEGSVIYGCVTVVALVVASANIEVEG